MEREERRKRIYLINLIQLICLSRDMCIVTYQVIQAVNYGMECYRFPPRIRLISALSDEIRYIDSFPRRSISGFRPSLLGQCVQCYRSSPVSVPISSNQNKSGIPHRPGTPF